jgi:hypothetical protein
MRPDLPIIGLRLLAATALYAAVVLLSTLVFSKEAKLRRIKGQSSATRN